MESSNSNQQQPVIQDNTGLLKEYTSNDHIDEATRKKFPETYDTALVLTFLDEKAARVIEIKNRIIKRSHRSLLPGHKFDTKAKIELDQNDLHAFFRRQRAVVGPSGMNERIAENTQISHNVVAGPQQDTVHSAGYLSTLPIIGKYFR